MSSYMDNKWSWIDGTHQMRNGLLDTLTDADLAFTPGGNTMSLGALCREMGDIEYAYLQSIKTAATDFTYRNTEAGIESSVAALKTWYLKLDAEMKDALTPLADADFQKLISRSSGYQLPLELQLDIYLQALLIFFGKITIYLKIMEKPVSATIQEYIG